MGSSWGHLEVISGCILGPAWGRLVATSGHLGTILAGYLPPCFLPPQSCIHSCISYTALRLLPTVCDSALCTHPAGHRTPDAESFLALRLTGDASNVGNQLTPAPCKLRTNRCKSMVHCQCQGHNRCSTPHHFGAHWCTLLGKRSTCPTCHSPTSADVVLASTSRAS